MLIVMTDFFRAVKMQNLNLFWSLEGEKSELN